MRRIYPDYTYGLGPRNQCWWDETIAAPAWPNRVEARRIDVAIVGGGFTGISAALHLAQSGVDVAVFEARTPGWGASGRNGGFCCLGGSKLSFATMKRRYGEDAALTYAASEVAAVKLAQTLIGTHNIHADTHSQGETLLAHSSRAMRRLKASVPGEHDSIQWLDRDALNDHGLNAQAFHGGLTTPVGFALNPRKYLFGLANAASQFGASLFQNSPVTAIKRDGTGFALSLPNTTIWAKQVIVATNGYSSEDIPKWLRARYLPCQSTVLVTRPLCDQDLFAQGWTSDQMSYDTRDLLHYFRLMPDRRFLFGMRGGLLSSPTAEARARRRLVKDFRKLFPAWSHVDVTHTWSGMVSMGADFTPFIGAVPTEPGLFAGLNYHGNGIAMGTYAGHVLSDLVQGNTPILPYSPVVQSARRFPLGRWRRAILPLAYAYYMVKDFSF